MKVDCPNCEKTFTIRDEKLREGTNVSFWCPACKEGLITVDPENAAPIMFPKARDSSESPHEKPIRGEALKSRVLDKLDDLPPLPETVLKARELMLDPSSSIKELADALAADQSITAKVLRIANSAFYGMSGKVASIQRAAVLLGQRNLGEVVTLAGTSDLLGFELFGYGIGAGDLWRHSIAAAFSARRLAERLKPGLEEEAFIAGLMHDVGKIILDAYLLERKEAFDEFMDDGQRTFIEAEQEILGFDHSEIASEVCERWNIPAPVGVAIRFHHHPDRSDGNPLSYILHMADHIAIMSGVGASVDDILQHPAPGAMNFLGLSQEDLGDIVLDMMKSMEEFEAMQGD